LPLIEKRKTEASAIIMNALKFQEEEDNEMDEVSGNILKFFKLLGKKYDQNRTKLETTTMNYKLAFAKCEDHYDDIISE
jgi:hypothetical protein